MDSASRVSTLVDVECDCHAKVNTPLWGIQLLPLALPLAAFRREAQPSPSLLSSCLSHSSTNTHPLQTTCTLKPPTILAAGVTQSMACK